MDYRAGLGHGTRLSSYQIDSELGRGGFGITYKAFGLSSGIAYAIKEYYPAEPAQEIVRASGSASIQCTTVPSQETFAAGLERFIKEGNTLAMFRHPHIVQVQKLFRQNNTAYLVLAYERGSSMRAWLRQLGRPPTQDELDSLLMPLLSALRAIHRNKLLHRDLAPDNIYIRAPGNPVLLDFGSARRPEGAAGKGPTQIIKPGYSPYEQYLADPGMQGPWTDIYALAATLYEAITGEPPVEGRIRFMDPVDRYVPVRYRARTAYRAGFLQAIDKGLAPKKGDRPRTVSEWQQALFAVEPMAPSPPGDPGSWPRATRPAIGLIARLAQWFQ
jgi:serine/threonine protein kinase